MIVRDHIVCDRRRGSLDHDAASVRGGSLTTEISSAVLQRESIENGFASLSRSKADYRIGVTRINNRALRLAFTGNGNGLPSKVDMFMIGSWRHQHRITDGRDIDGRLDGWLVRRHFDRSTKFIYSHIDDCGSIIVAIEDSGLSVYILIRKIGRQAVAGVDGGRPLLEMIVALSGIGEQWIKRNIVVLPCHIGDGLGIGHSVDAEDIVESDDRRLLVGEDEKVETGLPGFCDYYVIGQFRLHAVSKGKDAGTI